MGVDPEQIKKQLDDGEDLKFLSVDEVMFNLVQINEWFQRMGDLYEQLHHFIKLSRSTLDQLGEPELAMKLDLAAEAFSSEFYGAFEEEIAEARKNLQARKDEQEEQEEDPEDDSGAELRGDNQP